MKRKLVRRSTQPHLNGHCAGLFRYRSSPVAVARFLTVLWLPAAEAESPSAPPFKENDIVKVIKVKDGKQSKVYGEPAEVTVPDWHLGLVKVRIKGNTMHKGQVKSYERAHLRHWDELVDGPVPGAGGMKRVPSNRRNKDDIFLEKTTQVSDRLRSTSGDVATGPAGFGDIPSTRLPACLLSPSWSPSRYSVPDFGLTHLPSA